MLLSIASVLLVLAGPRQLLENPEAQAKFAEAQAAFAEDDFAAAAAAVEAAYLIEPEPMLLYPWAQAERSQGHCDAAVELYQRFIDSEPPESLAEPARENMARCEEQLEAEAAERAEDEARDEQTPVSAPVAGDDELPPGRGASPGEPPTPARAWYRDPVGGVLAGVGLVGVGAGAGLMGAGASSARGVTDESMHREYLAARDRATGLRNAGAIALSIGGALLVGGVVRYAVVAKRSGSRPGAAWRLTPSLGRRFAGVTAGGRF